MTRAGCEHFGVSCEEQEALLQSVGISKSTGLEGGAARGFHDWIAALRSQ